MLLLFHVRTLEAVCAGVRMHEVREQPCISSSGIPSSSFDTGSLTDSPTSTSPASDITSVQHHTRPTPIWFWGPHSDPLTHLEAISQPFISPTCKRKLKGSGACNSVSLLSRPSPVPSSSSLPSLLLPHLEKSSKHQLSL